jgi:exopolysaccharide biosynthesis polyprenyl glycosylphosphotransferase
MLEPSEAKHALLRFAVDIALTLLALFLTSIVRPWLPFGQPLTTEHTSLSPIIYVLVALIWVGVFLLLSVYTPRSLRPVDEAQLIFVAVTLATLTLGGFLYFSIREVSRLQVLTFYFLDLLLLIGYRSLVRFGLGLGHRSPYPKRRVMVIDAGESGRDVARMVENHRWAGLEMVGFLDNEVRSQTTAAGFPVLGKIKDVSRIVKAQDINEIVVTLPVPAYDQFLHLIAELQKLPVRVRLVPDYFKTTLFRTRVDDFAGMPMLTLRQPTLDPFERRIKRAFDLLVGTLLLIISVPIMGIVAIAIRLDSPGPILFRQQRVGENGTLFLMNKFRSMVDGAEQRESEMVLVLEDKRLLNKQPGDPRVTRVGRFLRRTSMDEIPQLFNVLQGDMSLVGPRPELPWLVEQYEPWQWQRFAVPQGMTGWWQVNARSDKPMYLQTEEDMYYIQHYSLLLDIRILWRTFGVVFRGLGA